MCCPSRCSQRIGGMPDRPAASVMSAAFVGHWPVEWVGKRLGCLPACSVWSASFAERVSLGFLFGRNRLDVALGGALGWFDHFRDCGFFAQSHSGKQSRLKCRNFPLDTLHHNTRYVLKLIASERRKLDAHTVRGRVGLSCLHAYKFLFKGMYFVQMQNCENKINK